MSDFQWLDALIACRTDNEPCTLVTVLEVQGSLPRREGTKMLVTPSRVYGSVGGSALEHQAVERARRILSESIPVAIETFGAAGQDQPRITLLFEPFAAVEFIVAVFGAGHVGQALVKVLATLPCLVHWFDSRTELMPANLPGNVVSSVRQNTEHAVPELPSGTYYVLASPQHEDDFRIAHAVVRRNDAAYCGMIGSVRKRRQLEAYLHTTGDAVASDQVTCPIGLTGIAGRSPAEIAIAVAAQLLLVRDESLPSNT